jgi:UrcA family protein
MSLKTKIVLGWVTVVVLSMASSALYADSTPDEIRHSTAVHYADLNLNKTAGVAALYRRITAAASRVCGQQALTGSNYPLPEYTSCYNEAIATAEFYAAARGLRPCVVSNRRRTLVVRLQLTRMSNGILNRRAKSLVIFHQPLLRDWAVAGGQLHLIEQRHHIGISAHL